MKRFEKIVLEQLKRGDIGTAIADSVLISKLKNKFKYGVTVYMFIDKHGIGKKYPPLTADQVINEIPKNKGYKNYSNGEYIFVIDDQNPTSGKKETTWDVYIINKKKTFPDISDSVFDENKSGQFNQSVIVTFKQYNELLKKQNELAIAKEKADAEAAAVELEKKKPAIEKTKVVVQNVVKGTETIDPNNLGKGTEDAKSFQELLYQVGLKLIPTYISFKKFASYRTKGPDGGWDGDIGPATLNMLDKLTQKDKYKSGDIAGVIKDLRLYLLTTESTNYFKGTGMNIKLKDLLREQLIIKPDDEVTGGGTTNTKQKPSSTNFTPKSFPVKYTGKATYTWTSGTKYVGEFKDGKLNGQGTYKLKTGKIYDGTWSNGKKNGEFKVTFPNGDIRVGTYINDVFGGPATFTPKGGKPIKETWKDGKLLKSNADYWKIAKEWVDAEYNFWENGGSGPKGQKRPVSHKVMFNQFNYTWDDDEAGAKKAYLANRKIALQWLKLELQGSVVVTGEDYYTKIYNWIYEIAAEIDDVFQNDRTITLTNDEEGDVITRTVQGEIDT